MKTIACISVLLLLAGSAAAQQRASPSPAPATGGSPIPAVAGGAATNATAATNTTTEITDEAVGAADNDATTEAPDTTTPAAEGLKPSPDKRIKGFYDSPKAAAERIPELKELNRLVTASPAVTKLLKDKDLVATIFAPNNEAVKGALEYLTTNFPNMTVKELGEMGIIDSLLQYHVTAGNAALTSDRLKNGMKLTMLDGSPITLIKKAAAEGMGGRRHLLQAADSWFIRTNTNQSVAITDTNYQGGKAIIHVIDGVLIPASLAANYSLADVPGATNITAEETTAAEPTGAATGTKGPAEAPATTTPPSSPPSKSSAGTVAAALLAAPVLLAVIML
jgi:uncharacterized surface protein with fasciclin (FAS1) repeats